MALGKPEVLIIGAGVAGLACATRLQDAGLEVLVVEAADAPGGRIRTDVVDGFRLDRGFQVFLTAYPETSRLLDCPSLNLQRFHAGALVRFRGHFVRVGDPLRDWSHTLPSLVAPIGSLTDKLRIPWLVDRTTRPSIENLMAKLERTTLGELQGLGFSAAIIERFFRPFFGGIFLERELVTSSRKFNFIFRMFALGEAAIPAIGMEEIPKQLSGRLRPGSLRLGTMVEALTGDGVRLATGEHIDAANVVVATEQQDANGLLGTGLESPVNSTSCLYYTAEKSPVAGPWLVLNGTSRGLINNLCVPSEVSPEYAGSGSSLISVTVVGDHTESETNLESKIRQELISWYGNEVRTWRHLRTYNIRRALPLQTPPALTPIKKPAMVSKGRFVCGDWTDIASIEGAVLSGNRAAEAVLQSRLS